MIIYLAWNKKSFAEKFSQTAGPALLRHFQEFFALPLKLQAAETESAMLIWLEGQVPEWRVDRTQITRERTVIAPDFPLNFQDFGKDLFALADNLQTKPLAALARMIPPMTLLDLQPSGLRFYNDGLGMAQNFSWLNPQNEIVAISNRVQGFSLGLDCHLKVNSLKWAERITLRHFLGNDSGYENILFVEPGSEIIFAEKTAQKLHPVLQEWQAPLGYAREESFREVRNSLLNYLDHARRFCPEFNCGLSGGYDSRATVAAVLASGHEYRLRVKGSPGSADVETAKKLAEAIGVPIKVKEDIELPPQDFSSALHNIRRAIGWQSGVMVNHKHKTFLSKLGKFPEGSVNVMGQHAEIIRSRFSHYLQDSHRQQPQSDTLAMIADKLMERTPIFWKQEVKQAVREHILQVLHSSGPDTGDIDRKLNTFFLMQSNRRMCAGSLAAQIGIIIAPFLNPTVIRTIYNSDYRDCMRDEYHKDIVRSFAPLWQNIPYFSRHGRGDSRYYDNREYWQQFGLQRILDASTNDLQYLRELCDWELLQKHWVAYADIIAILALL